MFCPKCTLEIKGEDQETCPICSEPLIETPLEKTEEPTAEDLKIQELIADIDSSVTGSAEEPFSQETLDSEAEEGGETEPDFKLEMNDKMLESELEPESDHEVVTPTLAGEDIDSAPENAQPGDDLLVDLEKEFSLDDEMTGGELSSDQLDDDFYDLEKELGLVDEKIKTAEAEPPTTDFDKFALTEEEKSFALDDAVKEEESDDAAEPDSKEVLQKTLEELDPIKDMDPSQKKSSSFGLIALLVLLVIVCVIAYTKFKPEIEVLTKPDSAKIAKDEQLKEKVGPKADKQVEKAFVKEALVEVPAEEIVDKPVKAAAENPVKKTVEEPAAEKVEKIVEVKRVAAPPKLVKEEVVAPVKAAVENPVIKTVEEPSAEKVEKIVEVKKVAAPPKPVKEEVVALVKPSVTYSIHAGSFRKTEFAQKDVNRFNKLGFNSYIERVNLGDKGVWYRVKIGLYNSRAEALSAEKEFLKKTRLQSRVIRNK